MYVVVVGWEGNQNVPQNKHRCCHYALSKRTQIKHSRNFSFVVVVVVRCKFACALKYILATCFCFSFRFNFLLIFVLHVEELPA